MTTSAMRVKNLEQKNMSLHDRKEEERKNKRLSAEKNKTTVRLQKWKRKHDQLLHIQKSYNIRAPS